MKKKWLLVLISGATIALLAGCQKDIVVNTEDAKSNAITVEGVGEIQAKPDMAYVYINAEAKDQEAKAAKDKENAASTKAIKALKDLGLTDKEIETTNYQIHQYRDYTGTDTWKDVYQASHQIKVTVNDIAKISDVLTAVSGNEHIQISNISYDIKEKESLIQEAMKVATKNAEERAKQVAKAAGTSVKSLNSIEVHNQSRDMYYSMESVNMKADSASITPETQTIKVTVQASYNVKYNNVK